MNDLLYTVMTRSVSGHVPLQDLEAGPAQNTDRFLVRLDEVQVQITEIEKLQQEIKRMHESGKTLISTKEQQRHRKQMQEKVTRVNTLAHQVKGKLEGLEKETLSDSSAFSDQNRRVTVTSALRRKLKDQMSEFANIRQQIQKEYRDMVERRVYAVTGKRVTQEEIDHMIETGESETIFQQAILQQGRPAVLATMQEIEERHKAVKELEQGLMELNNLFLDMAVLVDEQGEQLNNIAAAVERSGMHVRAGAEQVQIAKNYQQKKRRCTLIASIVILLVVAIAVLIIVLINLRR